MLIEKSRGYGLHGRRQCRNCEFVFARARCSLSICHVHWVGFEVPCNAWWERHICQILRNIFPEYLYARIRLVGGIVNFFFSSFFSVDLSLVSFNWFLTVFVDNFPVEVCIQSLTEVCIFVLEVLVPKTGFLTVRNFVFLQTTLRVWDTFLFEGNKVSSCQAWPQRFLL